MDSLETRRLNVCGVGDHQPSPPGRPASPQPPRRKGGQSRAGVSRSEGLPSGEKSRCCVPGWGDPGPRLSWFPRSRGSAVSEGPWAPVVPRGPSVAPDPSTEARTPRLPPPGPLCNVGWRPPPPCAQLLALHEAWTRPAVQTLGSPPSQSCLEPHAAPRKEPSTALPRRAPRTAGASARLRP